MDFFVFQPFLAEPGVGQIASVFPCRYVGEILVIPLGFAFDLMFLTEVAAAGLFPFGGIAAHQFSEFQKVSDAAGLFELLVESGSAAGNADVFPKFPAEFRNTF